MPKFIVTFLATIDSKDTYTGTIGVTSPTTDYYPNRVKSTATEQYRKKFPGKQVAIVIQDSREVSNDEYLKATDGFIEIKS